MPLTIADFSRVANSTSVESRDIKISSDSSKVKLGNFVFSQGAAKNNATMAAFKAALENEYGIFGTNAFDTILGARNETNKSLRACDVKATLSNLAQIRKYRVVDEISRQLETSPRMLALPDDEREAVRQALRKDVFGKADLAALKTAGDVASFAAKRISDTIASAASGADLKNIGAREETSTEAKSNEATGLRNLKTHFAKGSTSVADLMKQGYAGAGMRINRSETNPVLLEKLKTNGVEPGYIYRNDWSVDDTRGFMADWNTPEARSKMDELIAADPALAAKCEGKDLREQIMLAGRTHPAAMSAVAEFVIEVALDAIKSGISVDNTPFKDLVEGLKGQFSQFELGKLGEGVSLPENKDRVKEAKQYLFAQIRDTVMNIGPGNDFYNASPVFKHFSERAIMKLDYNEGEKFSSGGAAHAGTFMRPERILNNRKPILGQIYRFTSRQSADTISAGAVTEALANDLTRIAGVPSQELEIVRGEYSDGHPKLMLAAKFANGYRDMENGMLKDGRNIPAKPGDPPPEKLGKYKAFFLLTADRDGVGKRGQNKGFVNGKFFAIDPGHSLEGNGKYLKVSDDFSFKDTYGSSSKPRFNNFSVFDDDTRFAKLKGLIDLRAKAQAGEFDKLFNDYTRAFNPEEPGISPAEKDLRKKICADIAAKKAEFDESLAKLLSVADVQLKLYDDLADDGPAMQEKAVETIANLEKFTSPTTWVSKHGKVALEHLEVKSETRVPWQAQATENSIVYHCDKPMDGSLVLQLETIARQTGAKFTYDAVGNTRIEVPKDRAEAFFAAMSEEKVAQMTHPEEYQARKTGGNPLKVAKDYSPRPYSKVARKAPPLDIDKLPAVLDVRVGGREVRLPKIHYQNMAITISDVSRPRTEGELRAALEARIQRGRDILHAVLTGNTKLFKPTVANACAVTLALHAAALAKGEMMYRGSFSVQDPQGHLARWLDGCNEVYLRSSTHAKPYQKMQVDGHLNMPRAIDVPEGMGGLFNGMRTFHYFTLPDTDHLQDAGGSGPRRRLFLKCETFGIYYSTALAHPMDYKKALSPGMTVRKPRFGNISESIAHMMSLFSSFFTPKDAPGIRKENLTKPQKAAIKMAVNNLKAIGEDAIANRLVANSVLDGAGTRELTANMADIVAHLPENEQKRDEVVDILENLLFGLENAAAGVSGEASGRMGNELMIDFRDLQ